jgi:hypothetical protein
LLVLCHTADLIPLRRPAARHGDTMPHRRK